MRAVTGLESKEKFCKYGNGILGSSQAKNLPSSCVTVKRWRGNTESTLPDHLPWLQLINTTVRVSLQGFFDSHGEQDGVAVQTAYKYLTLYPRMYKHRES